MGTWNAYGNEYWPADYLIDAHGQVRYAAVRRGRLRQDRNRDPRAAGRSGRAGRRQEPPDRRGRALPGSHARDLPRHRARARAGSTGPWPGSHDYGRRQPEPLALNDFAFSGTWNIADQPADGRSRAPASTCEFQAKHVYLVLSSPGERPLPVQVLLDGRPIPAADAGADVHGGVVTVRRQRLYTLVSLPRDERAPAVAALRPRRDRLRVHVRLARRRAPAGARTLAGPAPASRPAPVASHFFCVFWARTCGTCACPRRSWPFELKATNSHLEGTLRQADQAERGAAVVEPAFLGELAVDEDLHPHQLEVVRTARVHDELAFARAFLRATAGRGWPWWRRSASRCRTRWPTARSRRRRCSWPASSRCRSWSV